MSGENEGSDRLLVLLHLVPIFNYSSFDQCFIFEVGMLCVLAFVAV